MYNTPRMPGFTGEVSLSRHRSAYNSGYRAASAALPVVPQTQPGACDPTCLCVRQGDDSCGCCTTLPSEYVGYRARG
jgi:hypothetical protein